MTDEKGHDGHDDEGHDGHGDGDHGGEEFGERRTTAPMEDFEAREAAVGAAIALGGLAVAVVVPLVLA